MIFAILIAFFSLIALVTLHELGHFLLAKKFGVPVEEFGIGFPPRLFGRKIGETVYSLNLLPLGAFVKIYGEEGGLDDSLSFSQKPIWQRALIILGGVIVFWLIAIILLSIISSVWGMPAAVTDDEIAGLKDPKVQIMEVVPDYPAQEVDILPLDVILRLESGGEAVSPAKIKEVQQFIQGHKGEEMKLTLLRGNKEKEVKVRPNEEGKIGVGLVITGFKISPWYLSLAAGTKATWQMTSGIVRSLSQVLAKGLKGKKVEGVELRGPIGIGELMARSLEVGLAYFLYFLSLISVYLAIFNLLPIPAVDGGRLLFLGIEKLKGKPINPKIEQKVNAAFFILLVALLIFVTVKDVMRFF